MLTPARLEFTPDGTPWSAAYGDVYHSAHGGPDQARHVFLAGNALPERWQGRERFVIAETGFGLGLNFLATWQAWRADPQRPRRLHFVSYEKHPFSAADLALAHRALPEFSAFSEELLRHWPELAPGTHRLHLDGGSVILTLFFGDAVTGLRSTEALVDAFYLDGFSPARNPELWTPTVCKALARLAAPGATLATWSVAGAVRSALAEAEFDLEKRPGFAGKRQMLAARFRSRRPVRHPAPDVRRAIVIGAGIAGSTVAHRLASGGWQVTVLESRNAAGDGASGNLAGVLRPLPSADDNRLSRLTRAGFLATRRLLAQLPDARWAACGVLHLARDTEHECQQHKAVRALGWPETLLQYVDRSTAGTLFGQPVTHGGWWFPSGGWVQPPSVCRAALASFPQRIEVRYASPVATIDWHDGAWQARDEAGREIAAAPVLIMASGAAAGQFRQFAGLPQYAARGQVSHLPAAGLPPINTVLCQHGYTAPPVDGWQLAGASHSEGDPDVHERLADHVENLERLARCLPDFAQGIDPARLHGRVGFRPMSPDRLPIVGPMPQSAAPGTRLPRLAMQARAPGLWCALGYGARGIVWSALMADLLYSQIEGDPLPLANDLVNAVAPGRFFLTP